MPPTLPHTLTNGTPADADAVMDNLNTILAGVGPAVVTSLPGSPYDGQEIYYLADAAAGVVWHLKYRAASGSAYKWEYVGGSRLLSMDAPLGGFVAAFTNSNAVYTEMNYSSGGSPAAPLTLTLPLAGDYDISLEGHIQVDQYNMATYMSYSVGATAASDDWCISIFGQTAIPANGAVRTYRHAGVAAAASVAVKGRTSGSCILYAYNRVLAAVPVRVG